MQHTFMFHEAVVAQQIDAIGWRHI